MKVGDIVTIRVGVNHNISKTGNIAAISKTWKKVDILLDNGVTTSYYRQDGKYGDPNVYVNNPGAGIGGSFLNDRFLVSEIKSNS